MFWLRGPATTETDTPCLCRYRAARVSKSTLPDYSLRRRPPPSIGNKSGKPQLWCRSNHGAKTARFSNDYPNHRVQHGIMESQNTEVLATALIPSSLRTRELKLRIGRRPERIGSYVRIPRAPTQLRPGPCRQIPLAQCLRTCPLFSSIEALRRQPARRRTSMSCRAASPKPHDLLPANEVPLAEAAYGLRFFPANPHDRRFPRGAERRAWAL